ncbi:hypothetical protein Pcinc_028505 [Petrolisthes cinctipes]|uniref:Ribonucleoside-diphosphate reductase n=1 Tax=Petrolisthes cinctipes TaxID=88211 RepID=A0AAE1F261_PETCI|nr:hypothetical protein Pcinc_028505 [Petrolisthes cinctipes]
MDRMCGKGIIDPKMNEYVQENADFLERALRHDKDKEFSFFGLRSLFDKYLLKDRNGIMVERPQHMLMREAIAVSQYSEDPEKRRNAVLKTYEMLSERRYTHATPTLFNACTTTPQLSSCFLVVPKGGKNQTTGFLQTLADVSEITSNTGGVGIAVQDYPAMGSYMKETNSQSKGLIPLLKMTDCFVAATKQDSGNRRQTAVAVYNELWHPDIINFLKMRRPGTDETDMAKDLFFGLWVNDLFMERLVENGTWTLMCPKRCPGLSDLYGEEFKKKYEEYERTMPDLPKIQCKKLWSEIIVAQIETGLPFMCFKDAVNYKSNQKHIGTIKCSNLCTEIMEYSSSDETAVCNLASVAVNMYVDKETRTFDFGKMTGDVRIVTKNLDNVIDRTRYPTEEARRSNLRHRPVGIGIQGLADAFMLMGMVYCDPESMILNRRIAKHIYYAAVEASCDLAKERGTYPAFEGSPACQGLLQFDLWREEQERKTARGFTTKFRPIVTELDWDMLKRDKLLKHGMRNSYVVAPMPTASTAQILGNNESFEPFTSNLYTRNVTNGMFKVVNKHLFRHLFENNMWSPGWGDLLLDTHGSV